MTKMSEDETRMRDAEAKQKLELLKVGEMKWPMRPAMSDHCAAGAPSNIFQIHELKNRSGNCPDFIALTAAARSERSWSALQSHDRIDATPLAPRPGMSAQRRLTR
jgi:hypothetical protein